MKEDLQDKTEEDSCPVLSEDFQNEVSKVIDMRRQQQVPYILSDPFCFPTYSD